MDDVAAWLLDPADPAVRAMALVDLFDRAPDDPDVQAARKEIGERGSAARLIDALRVPTDPKAFYKPKYEAPFHRLIALAEMGVPASHPAAGALLSACLDVFIGPEEGPWDSADHEVCLTGNLARAALLMGRGDDPRAAHAIAWLVDAQLPDGGWHCWPDRVPHGTLDAWEALGALAAIARERRTPAIRAAAQRGVEFLLENGLGVHDPYEPWRRLHFPRHYYYDVLLGLELATALGDPHDARLQPALDWLLRKRGPDGRWRLDAQHPDIGEGADYALQAPATPLRVEEAGAPSRWVTLAALRVLRRAGKA